MELGTVVRRRLGSSTRFGVWSELAVVVVVGVGLGQVVVKVMVIAGKGQSKESRTGKCHP